MEVGKSRGRRIHFLSHCCKEQSRIYLFLSSNTIIEQELNCEIGPIILSDPATMELDIIMNPGMGRKGRWRL